MSRSPLSLIQLMQYGFLAVPVAFAGFPLYVLAPDFYATHQGLSLSVLGAALLGLRSFDALVDPVIGMLSDRFAHKIYVWMAVSALLLVASIYALFHPMSSLPLLWFAGSMAIAVTTYSILSINLNTLGALWTHDRHEQTRITSLRESLGLLGLLLAVILPGVLGKYLPASAVFSGFCIILSVLMFVALLTFGWWFSDKNFLSQRHRKKHNWLVTTLRGLHEKTYHLFAVYGLSILASSIPAVLVIFFVRDRLNAESYTGAFLLLYFLSGALTMQGWKIGSVRYGKHIAWLFSMLLAVASFIWAFFLRSGDIWQYALICISSGIALGADLVLPPSILADHIHSTHAETSAATQFSILTLLAKAGLAVGSAIVLPLLDFISFKPAMHNTEAALLSLSAAYALIPCIIKLAAAYLLYHLFIQPKGITYEISLENSVSGSSSHA